MPVFYNHICAWLLRCNWRSTTLFPSSFFRRETLTMLPFEKRNVNVLWSSPHNGNFSREHKKPAKNTQGQHKLVCIELQHCRINKNNCLFQYKILCSYQQNIKHLQTKDITRNPSLYSNKYLFYLNIQFAVNVIYNHFLGDKVFVL